MSTKEHHEALINKFYTAFHDLDPQAMRECYHQDVVFQDPAFGILKGREVGDMWEMLINGSKKSSTNRPLQISYKNVQANETTGSVEWTAVYNFSATGREVTNQIHGSFLFQDGLIVQHTDVFDFWKWR
jgi:ketosteroid isomerase-like protein